jgi:hypothetical protein
MAFDVIGLSPIGGQSKRGKSVQRWAYKSTDTLATMMADSYFDTYALDFNIGDLIDLCVVDSMTTPTVVSASNQVIITSISTARVVKVADYGSISGTPADYSAKLRRLWFEINATDLSAGTTQYLIAPNAGIIQRVVTCIQVQISTGGVVTASAAGTTVAGVSITVANSAAVGTVQTGTPTAGDSSAIVAAGASIGILSSAAFTGGGQITGFVEVLEYANDTDVIVPFTINATDLSAGTSQYIPSPCAGQITGLGVITQVLTVTGGDVTVELANVAVVGLTATVADASAVGTVVTDAPTSLTGATGAVTKDQAIEIVCAAAFNGGGAINGYIRIKPTVPQVKKFLHFKINSTDLLAGTSHYLPMPEAGNVNRATTVVQVAIGTGGNVTFEKSNVAVSGLTVVVANSSSVGDIDIDTAAYNDVTTEFLSTDAIEIVSDAAFATTGELNGYIELTPTT